MKKLKKIINYRRIKKETLVHYQYNGLQYKGIYLGKYYNKPMKQWYYNFVAGYDYHTPPAKEVILIFYTK